jgi:DNA-binding transcriptional LysR family regulator
MIYLLFDLIERAMDRLSAMQTFVRVVETGGFSAVARERNSAQSAVSKQVAALEGHLGTKLLIRTTRSLALTEDGERYFEATRRLIGEVAEAEAQLRQGQQQLSGWMRVAAPAGFGLRVMLPYVKRFLVAHPDVRIDFQLNDSFIDLIEQGIDVAVRIGALADSSLIARRVGSSRGVVVASKAYIEALPASLPLPLMPDELLLHPCIVYTASRTRNAWSLTGPDDATATVSVSGPLQTNNSELVRASVLLGLGISLVPTWMFKDELASGDVQRLMPNWAGMPLPIHLVYAPHRQRSAKVQAFSEHIALALAE